MAVTDCRRLGLALTPEAAAAALAESLRQAVYGAAG
jgi:hypothetical protein